MDTGMEVDSSFIYEMQILVSHKMLIHLKAISEVRNTSTKEYGEIKYIHEFYLLLSLGANLEEYGFRFKI